MNSVATFKPAILTKEDAVPEEIQQPVTNTAPVEGGGAPLFAFGDEDNVPPKQLVPHKTTLELRIVGTPKIQAGLSGEKAKRPGLPYAFLKGSCLPVDEVRFGDCDFISFDISLPTTADTVSQSNEKQRAFNEMKRAVGWTPPRGLVPQDANGQEFPELKDATFTGVVTQQPDTFHGGMENVVAAWVAEKE